MTADYWKLLDAKLAANMEVSDLYAPHFTTFNNIYLYEVAHHWSGQPYLHRQCITRLVWRRHWCRAMSDKKRRPPPGSGSTCSPRAGKLCLVAVLLTALFSSLWYSSRLHAADQAHFSRLSALRRAVHGGGGDTATAPTTSTSTVASTSSSTSSGSGSGSGSGVNSPQPPPQPDSHSQSHNHGQDSKRATAPPTTTAPVTVTLHEEPSGAQQSTFSSVRNVRP
jgi:hypothetical protein